MKFIRVMILFRKTRNIREIEMWILKEYADIIKVYNNYVRMGYQCPKGK